jgi:hypothetical protein
MADHTNIPRTIKGFNQYINQTCAYLMIGTPTNAVRFNWTPADVTAWIGFQTAWAPLFLLYSDRKGSYTTDIKNSLLKIIAQAVVYDKEHKLIFKVKGTSDLSAQDCSTFNLPQKLAMPVSGAHSLPAVHIASKTIVTDEPVYPKLIPLSGGYLKVECFIEATKSGRARKLQGFDEVEYAIGVFLSGTANTPLVPTDARLTTDYSSKADFTIATAGLTNNIPVVAPGTLQPNKMAVLFFRWAKSKHPNLNGPWSGPFTTPLL